MGFCPQCGADEPLVEEAASPRPSVRPSVSTSLPKALERDHHRTPTGWAEFDRVIGGGLVEGSVLLVGGEPGVGKSTLLLQVAGSVASLGTRVLVASAEESVHQVAMRAARLGVDHEMVHLVSDSDTDAIVNLADEMRPGLLVVDSIQTVGVQELGSSEGGVAQVRESAARLARMAKKTGVPVVLVGHVTKEGGLAGPKLLEHMVDVVMYLEGDPDRGFRVLRSLKNRFGATHVSGMFDMQSVGLVELADPSKIFLESWETEVPGTVVYPAVEGRRSVLVEIQALVAPSSQAQPRRSIQGLDARRVNQVIAVLSHHGQLPLHDQEIYLNVVGGWRLDEPGSDLPVALALASSARGRSLGRLAAWGEIGLAGEVRSIPFESRRLDELNRMGLDRWVAPTSDGPLRLGEALRDAGLGA